MTGRRSRLGRLEGARRLSGPVVVIKIWTEDPAAGVWRDELTGEVGAPFGQEVSRGTVRDGITDIYLYRPGE